MGEKIIRQRMIFMCDLPIGEGSEFSGVHPVLIGSGDLRNNNSPNIYIFPITHSLKKYQPTHVSLLRDNYDFFKYKVNTILCESGREVSRSRIQRYLGAGVGGFAAMKALSTRNDDPKKSSRPFDIDRDGFVMGEGAGVGHRITFGISRLLKS